jgi:hypothetical protein
MTNSSFKPSIIIIIIIIIIILGDLVMKKTKVTLIATTRLMVKVTGYA